MRRLSVNAVGIDFEKATITLINTVSLIQSGNLGDERDPLAYAVDIGHYIRMVGMYFDLRRFKQQFGHRLAKHLNGIELLKTTFKSIKGNVQKKFKGLSNRFLMLKMVA